MMTEVVEWKRINLTTEVFTVESMTIREPCDFIIFSEFGLLILTCQ